jgi:hypothetical protein
MTLERAMKNPSDVFARPELVAAAAEFTYVQKRAILVQWKDQIEKLLIADEESMVRAGSSGVDADRLRRVSMTLAKFPH